MGSSGYVEEIKGRLGIKAAGRRIEKQDGICIIREEPAPYNIDFDLKNKALRQKNSYFWDDN